MKIGSVITNDLANGTGLRVSVFVSGCPHHCEGCHNPELWDKNVGTEMTSDAIDKIIYELRKDGIKRDLSILGGEPLAPYNIKEVGYLITCIRKKVPDLNIWIWTGYTYEDLRNFDNPDIEYVLSKINVLVDGPFIKEQKVGDHPWRGSSNQRIYDMSAYQTLGAILVD